MRNRTKRVCATALCILCLLALFPVRAAAAGAIDTSHNVRLTVEYRHDGKPVASVPFDLYYVASVDAYANFTLAGDFAAYPVTLENLTAAEWTALAETLAAYAERDNLTPLDSGKTDAQGTLILPEDLLNKTIDVKGIVDIYEGQCQIRVFSMDHITIQP